MDSNDDGRASEAWHVRRTLAVLELLTFAPLAAPDVARATQSQPRTVRRVLNRLVEDEYLAVRQDGRRRVYEPTMRLAALGSQVVANSPITQAARPYVELAHERTGGVARLVLPAYRDAVTAVYVASRSSDSNPRLCELLPAHATAGGKALLAFRESWSQSLLAQPLAQLTVATVTDPDALRTQLHQVLEDGVAFERGEREPAVQAVAVPVRVGREVVAALSVSGGSDLDLADSERTARDAADRLVRDLERRR